jgi:hypothetical protein
MKQEEKTMKKRNQLEPKSSTYIIGLILLVVIAGYSLFQAKNLIIGPVMTIEEPLDGATLPFSLYTVRGSAQNISQISLNDKPIFVNDRGIFQEKLIAPPGYSIIKMTVKDRFGRSKTQHIHLMHPADENPLLFPLEEEPEQEEVLPEPTETIPTANQQS